jgi:hypothetical protein
VRRTSHPMRCFTEKVFLGKPLEDFEFSQTYIKASKNRSSDIGADVLWQAANRAKNSPDWQYCEIETTHMVASNKPKMLFEILIKVLANEA